MVAGGREVPSNDDARSAENQHKDDRARCEVAGMELGIKRLTKWLARDEAQKEGWKGKAKPEGVSRVKRALGDETRPRRNPPNSDDCKDWQAD